MVMMRAKCVGCGQYWRGAWVNDAGLCQNCLIYGIPGQPAPTEPVPCKVCEVAYPPALLSEIGWCQGCTLRGREATASITEPLWAPEGEA